MTDYELLNSMSSTFNNDCATSTAEGGTLLNLDLAEDKTLKWRNLANNQFACKDKKHKDKEEERKEARNDEEIEDIKGLLADVVDAAAVKLEEEAAAEAATQAAQNAAEKTEEIAENTEKTKEEEEASEEMEQQKEDGEKALVEPEENEEKEVQEKGTVQSITVKLENSEQAEKSALAATSAENGQNESIKTEQQKKKAAQEQEKEEAPLAAEKQEANAELATTTATETTIEAAASPLVVHSASVDVAADATDSNSYVSSELRTETPAEPGAAAAADKNEQVSPGGTRRSRRTPRPTDTPTPTATPTPVSNECVQVEITAEPEASEQQVNQHSHREVPKLEEIAATLSQEVKKEPEKTPPMTTSLPDENPAPAPKRGRGRAKKVRPDAEVDSSEVAQPLGDDSVVEKKPGRKRKLPEEQTEHLPLTDVVVVVKTEQEDLGDAPSGDGKRMRRSVRLGNRLPIADGAPWDEVKSEPAAHQPPAELALLEVTSLPMPPAVLDEKTPPKKRGRKAKIPPGTKIEPGTSSSSGQPLTNGSKKSNPPSGGGGSELQLPKRPKRRIKPTPKILENDELRCEFETKQIERMTHWESAAAAAAEGDFETPPTGGGGGVSNSSTTRQKSDKSDGSNFDGMPGHPAGTSAIKKRLFSKSQRDIENYGAAMLAKSKVRPCPDVEQFLSDIKASRINANRSPEERKLNKKQQRKLAKQKEKHLKHLGLQRNHSEEASDNDSSNTDNEFVPTTRVQVGKPSVTLRVRNTVTKELPTTSAAAQQKLSRNPVAVQPTKHTRRVGVRGVGGGGAGGTVAAGPAGSISTLDAEQLHSLNTSILAEVTPIRDLDARPSTSKTAKFICLCQKGSQYYARNAPDSSYCCAIDHIDEQKIGCCNELSSEVHNLLRPSQRVSYMILCDEHKKRLHSHNCCAGCGIFCTQGKFVLCKQQHFFHPDCAQRFILNTPFEEGRGDREDQAAKFSSPMLVLKCPHCGLDTPERTSTVTMKCQSLPVFLPTQKYKIKPAKLTTASHLTQFGAAGKASSPGAKAKSKGTSSATVASGTASSSSAAKSNGTPRGKAGGRSNSNSGQALNTINFAQLIPDSVMNVVLRGHVVSASGRVTTEFTSRDMYYAVQNDDLERVAEILASDFNVLTPIREYLNGTCLHLVAHQGTLQMAYLLLCKGAISQDFVNIVDSELRTALMCAVMNEKCDMLNLFLQCGADVAIKGPDGKTCLHIAAKLGNVEATQLIVESYRASRNITSFLSFIDAQDEGGWTAMVWAAELGHTDIVSFLLNQEADPNICDNDNNTVLHWSTLHNDGLDTITVLLQAGADCNVQNVEGDTPLHIACRHSGTRMCIALIANGADLMIKNKAEQLPFDCIPNEESECGRTVGFNMQMRSFRPLGLRTLVVCADASNGREARPIQAVRNELAMSESEDEADSLMWPHFRYVTQCIIQQNSVQIDRRVSQMRICSCPDSCSSDRCQCNGASSQNWYTAESRLTADFNYEDPAVIFECNDVCGCNQLSCKNRVVQNGTRTPLQIMECEEQAKGWGVRALANVPKGTFVASYTGEILTALEADRRTDDSYYFDLDNGHCIDANYYGNVTRFFNHSCEPNILPVRVFYEHQDYRFPKIAFFACRDIDAGEEICYDYGEKFWRVDRRSSVGCRCQTASCKYASQSSSTNASPTDAATAAEPETEARPASEEPKQT
ncbi:LOW QUALITY PROTEIN: histone-lysine N-methyltransferase EHMT2 [Drosophila ficusphila]|uniref:LOW QUALITY PROTEIN: histone-lysine N-methyltransferase EHMT2 n=1 Tax=Drosophila ficusphila TaxID=30025 RepID=UPI001C8AF4D9|nr:LOW QUALITY PROTEIN: histone-lysine N-methyltransferase EHMT2 [Drosophila ficusphila]